MEEKAVHRYYAIKPASLVGYWKFIPEETLGNNAKHVPHKYPVQEPREQGCLYNHTQESLIEGYLGLLISERFRLAFHSDN